MAVTTTSLLSLLYFRICRSVDCGMIGNLRVYSFMASQAEDGSFPFPLPLLWLLSWEKISDQCLASDAAGTPKPVVCFPTRN